MQKHEGEKQNRNPRELQTIPSWGDKCGAVGRRPERGEIKGGLYSTLWVTGF